jgi:branched-chain amino acid transport system substrate-binding protein
LDEVNNEILGHRIELMPLDHRSNVIRSQRNYETYLADPNALAMFSGLHSVPLIRNRTFINKNKALTFVPWAAAGPITRYPSPENWVFRVSLDDMRSGYRIVDYAIEAKDCTTPILMLESTPWGDSNLKTMGNRLQQRGIIEYSVERFGFGLQESAANILIARARKNKSDCLILVANSAEGLAIARALTNIPEEERIPVISHWGIIGGNFFKIFGIKDFDPIDLSFIQTCFSFNQASLNSFQQSVLDRAIYLFNDVDEAADIKASVGFIHGYDGTRILLEAIRQVSLTGNIATDKNNVRLALENLNKPVEGLIKTYDHPFSAYDEETNPNGHEALGPDSYCMARYDSQGDILLIPHGNSQ